MAVISAIQLKLDSVSAEIPFGALIFPCIQPLLSGRFTVFYQPLARRIYQNDSGALMNVVHNADGSSRVIHF